jgi:hypothetical protein
MATLLPHIHDIHTALGSLDVAYHMNHRKNGMIMFDVQTGIMLEGIGHMITTNEPDARRIFVESNTPYPCDSSMYAHKDDCSSDCLPRFLAALSCVALLVGCPADTGGMRGDAGVSTPCDAWHGWWLRCGQDAGDDDWDVECRKIRWSSYDPRWSQTASKCLETLECGRADDVCTDEAFQVCGVTKAKADQAPVFQACLAAAHGCKTLDDMCEGLLVLAPAAHVEAERCDRTAEACELVGCYKAVLTLP